MRVFVLAAPSLSEFGRHVLERLLASGRHRLCGCAIDVRPPEPLRRRLRHNLRRGRGGYVLIMAAKLFARRGESVVPTRAFCERNSIPVHETVDPYAPETIAAIRSHRPDVLVLIGGFGILQRPLLDLVEHGVLSYHHGDMRRYRGAPPALWELYNGERELTVTVQRLREALDAGEPIVEWVVPIRDGESVGSLRSRAFAGSEWMLLEALERIERPEFEPEPIDSFGPVYTLPNLRQWLLLQARIGARRLRAARARDGTRFPRRAGRG
jgi:folate-dependent phosphoribosylglycinamide formyltransferase PurN